MACTAQAMPAAFARRMSSYSCSSVSRGIPTDHVPSYGAIIHAVWGPSAPSANIFTGPSVSHSSPNPERRPREIAAESCSCGMPFMTRSFSSPRASRSWNASRARVLSKSWMPVSPSRWAAACASLMRSGKLPRGRLRDDGLHQAHRVFQEDAGRGALA